MATLPEHPRCPFCGSNDTERHWGDQLMQFGAGLVAGFADGYFLGGALTSSNEAAVSKGADSLVDSLSQKYTCNKCNRDFTLGEVKKGMPAPKQPSKPKVKSPNNGSNPKPQNDSLETKIKTLAKESWEWRTGVSPKKISRLIQSHLGVEIPKYKISDVIRRCGSSDTNRIAQEITKVVLAEIQGTKTKGTPSNNKACTSTTYSSSDSHVETDVFEMRIEGVFEIPGRGPIITGKIGTGCVYAGETINISGDTWIRYQAEVVGIEMFGKLLDRAEEGDNCVILLKGIGKDVLQPGMIASHTLHVRETSVKAPANGVSQNTHTVIAPEVKVVAKPTQQPDNSENEQSYLEEYRQCLKDGEISASEIRLLNRLAKSLGISEERARELEASLTQPQLVLSAEEEDYLAEYKEVLAEGEVSATSRRLLNKIRTSLGISEERATEIENSLK